MRSAAGVFVPKSNRAKYCSGCAARVPQAGRKQKVNGKGGLLWTVRSEKSLDLSGFAAPNRGRWYKVSPAPENGLLTVTKRTMTNTIYIRQPEKRSASPGSRISSLKPPHSSPCPTRQRFCTPLSCAGRRLSGKNGGRTSTGGFTCTIPSARWLTCSTVGGRKREHPAGTAILRDWWRSRSRAVENPTVFSQNPMKRFQTPTSRNPVLVRRRDENRTQEVRKSLLRSTKTGRYIEIQR